MRRRSFLQGVTAILSTGVLKASPKKEYTPKNQSCEAIKMKPRQIIRLGDGWDAGKVQWAQ